MPDMRIEVLSELVKGEYLLINSIDYLSKNIKELSSTNRSLNESLRYLIDGNCIIPINEYEEWKIFSESDKIELLEAQNKIVRTILLS